MSEGSKEKQSLLKRIWKSKYTLLQGFFLNWILYGLILTVVAYANFVKLQLMVLKEFTGALLPITTTILGFSGALIVLEIQSLERIDSEQRRIAMDCWYKLVELSSKDLNEPSQKKMWLELEKILKDTETRTVETRQSEKYFKKFATLLIAIFIFAIFVQITVYVQLSANVSSPTIHFSSWFALMMTLGAFVGFAFMVWIILS